ncbi:antitoxin [Allokutzneria multivorans]|uniref:Antitoxin n=1 Tax=Allokutzneria multivorans TaxID=1142134 RepID=A0ABP7TB97_9PSEU
MGLGDKLNELKDKALDQLGKHGDKAEQGVDKASEFANEKTGGKHAEHVQKGGDALKEQIRNRQT